MAPIQTVSDMYTLEGSLSFCSQENLHIHTVATVTKNLDGQHLTDFEGLLKGLVQ